MTEKEFYAQIGGNYEEALGRMMNNALIKRFVLKFKDDKSFDSLKSAVLDKNWDEAFSYSHTLKGVSLNMAFSKLSDVAITLTDMLRPQNKDLLDEKKVTELFYEVEKEYLKVIDNIEKIQ